MRETDSIRDALAKAAAQGRVTVRGKRDAPIVAADITEAEFMRQVVYYATRQGWRYHHHFDSRKSVAGWPDLVLVRGTRLLFAELKTATGRLTAAQASWIDLLRDAGQTVFLWRPKDWAEIMEILE